MLQSTEQCCAWLCVRHWRVPRQALDFAKMMESDAHCAPTRPNVRARNPSTPIRTVTKTRCRPARRSRSGFGTARWTYNRTTYRFKQRLLANKAREYPWCKVLIVDEAYTSKTCGMCGHIHQSLGGNKVFRCPHCSFEIDRDVNGARNILLRFLTLCHETSSTQ